MDQLTIQYLFDLALQRHQAGQLQEAEQLYRQILAQQPEHVDALHHLGLVLHQAGRNDVAVDLIRRAIALMPEYAAAYCNLGHILKDSGEIDAAIAACRRAVALDRNLSEAHNNLGNALHEKEQFDEAIAACRRAVALRPNFAQAWNNLGNAVKGKGQLDEAVAAYRQALDLDRKSSETFANLGSALKDTGQLDEAITAYRHALAIDPDNAAIHSHLVFAIHFHPAYDGHAIAQELSHWNRRHAEPLRKNIQPPHRNDPSPDRRLRIGYVSANFREHVAGQHLMPLFREHDRRQFEITCYAHVRCPDAMTSQFQQSADRWRNIACLSDDQVAKQIREDEIDLLVDLGLHTSGNRLLVFAGKPAPVQATYLSYCGTTGMSTVDYRLSDPHLDPPGADLSCYTETTLCLPRSYWCYDPPPAPEPAPAPALTNGVVTFGCLCDFAKVSVATLDLWARILVAVPDSRMVIHAQPGNHVEGVVHRLSGAGVAKNRLHFVARQSWTQYMQTYSQIDIALDPFPYAGGITTCDALWMGVPVVSLSGQTAVGRGGRSILSNLGLTELIAFTPDQYVQIAIDLAQDQDRTNGLRRGMRERMLASPLMDAAGFARDIEAAYRQMWRKWCEGNSW